MKQIVSGFRILQRDGLFRLLHLLLIKFCGLLVRIVDASSGNSPSFNPYAHLLLLKPIPCDVVSVGYEANSIALPFTLITTVKNESANILRFLKSIEGQSLRPDEIIIVDGGSSDQTSDLIKTYLTEVPLPISLFNQQNCNIAEGRNCALAACSHEIVVMTDAGCWLDEHFCKNLVGAFTAFPDADLVGGVWTPAVKTRYNLQTPVWDEVRWDSFLPSARAMAVKKSICGRIGGFPEYLTLTGEDTLFAISYRRLSQKWVFNRNAVVHWQAPTSRDREQRVAFNYGVGDGESGVGDFTYYQLLNRSNFLRRMALISPYAFEGYLEGRRNRSIVEVQRRNISGLVIILSGVSFTNSGGDQKGTQLAIEFITRNYKVFFVNLDTCQEELCKVYFSIDYSLLELYALADFNCEELSKRYHAFSGQVLVISVFPTSTFAHIIEQLKKAFPTVTISSAD